MIVSSASIFNDNNSSSSEITSQQLSSTDVSNVIHDLLVSSTTTESAITTTATTTTEATQPSEVSSTENSLTKNLEELLVKSPQLEKDLVSELSVKLSKLVESHITSSNNDLQKNYKDIQKQQDTTLLLTQIEELNNNFKLETKQINQRLNKLDESNTENAILANEKYISYANNIRDNFTENINLNVTQLKNEINESANDITKQLAKLTEEFNNIRTSYSEKYNEINEKMNKLENSGMSSARLDLIDEQIKYLSKEIGKEPTRRMSRQLETRLAADDDSSNVLGTVNINSNSNNNTDAAAAKNNTNTTDIIITGFFTSLLHQINFEQWPVIIASSVVSTIIFNVLVILSFIKSKIIRNKMIGRYWNDIVKLTSDSISMHEKDTSRFSTVKL